MWLNLQVEIFLKSKFCFSNFYLKKTQYRTFYTKLCFIFRSIFLAYLLTIVKAYTLLIVPLYVCLMLIAICIKKRNCIIDSGDLLGALISFGCSAHESRHVGYTFRPLSKIIFALIFLPTVVFLTYATADSLRPLLPPLLVEVLSNLGNDLGKEN